MSTNKLFIEALTQVVGSSHVLTSHHEKAAYCEDWRGRYRGDGVAVVLPATTAEVSAVVALCADHGVTVVPQGGNTGLCGGATPVSSDGSIVLSLKRMRQIRHVDPLDRTITVEAGCTLAEVQATAEDHGCLFPLSLASEGSCQIGGNISTNAGGVHVLRYGNTRQLVLGLEVVLADGRVWDGLRRLHKDNTGYDLKHLFIGAEGTLGIVTAAVLKMVPRPAVRAVAWAQMPSPDAALSLLDALRRRFGERISAFELIGGAALDVVLRHIPGARAPLESRTEWSVLLEVADVDPDAPLAERLEDVLMTAYDHGLMTDMIVAASGAQEAALWGLRENISEAQRIEGVSIKHDISVPVSRIPEFLARAESAVAAAADGVRIVAFGHMGDGNLHYNLSCVDPYDNRRLVEATPALNRAVHDVVYACDGSISAEHGLGQLKVEEIKRYKSPLELEMLSKIKDLLDPRGLLNPGKVVAGKRNASRM